MSSSSEPFNTLCDVVTLCYHESRNVRHLLRENLLEPEPWKVVVSLPINRHDAWRALVPSLTQARQTNSVDAALKVFETRFHVSLDELAAMFADQNWRHARAYGGNAWQAIVRLVLQLADALRRNDVTLVGQFETKLKDARHNTGSLQEKLTVLAKALVNDQRGA